MFDIFCMRQALNFNRHFEFFVNNLSNKVDIEIKQESSNKHLIPVIYSCRM